ncbi:MAG: hypothetical protein IJ860_07920 [Eubacterium sp.]|nr:hypothetical protein [Eubacterium sp.]
MSTKIKIEWKPQGFAECLEGLGGQVQAEAEKIAARASGYLTGGGGFHVEMANAPRYQDSSYGVSRPVAYVMANDDESSKEEAENKILSKAVTG